MKLKNNIHDNTIPKADIIVDMQFGSTGKGLIAGYLGRKGTYDTVISANRPNAGHTFVDRDGHEMIHKVLPSSCIGANVRTVLIGPGAVFSLDQLYLEMDNLKLLGYLHFRVLVHEAAVILSEEHKNAEEGLNEQIGSTQQGAMVAAIHKMERDEESSPLAKHNIDIRGDYARVVSASEYANELEGAKEILLEGAQGYSLGIDAGFWPYCTSRNCTVTSFMSDMAVPHTMLRHVIGSLRTFPIRVAGNSGPCYHDQKEIKWADIGMPEEFTTVTKRLRRVFTFSNKQMIESIRANRPDMLFLNFCNHLDAAGDQTKLVEDLNEMMYEYGIGGEVRYLGYGPSEDNVIDLEKDIRQ